MTIQLKNCKNIDSAEITVEESKLNIKYAMNGTGKSTIARAIQLSVEGNPDLSELIPFKYRDRPVTEQTKPSISGCQPIGSIAVFNEGYMGQFTFKPDELLTNSFEVFVKTPDFEKRMAQIEELTKAIRESFKDSAEISQVVSDFSTFIDSFGKAQSGYSAAGPLGKGIAGGNKIDHIPAGLETYSDYLRSEKKASWITWQTKGTEEYLGLSAHCPFCTSEVESKKETIEKVKVEYNAKSIEHLGNVLASIEKVGKYFSGEVNARVKELSHKAIALTKEELNYLVQIKEQVATLREKLTDLRGISYFSMKDVGKIIDYLEGLKINLDFMQLLKSEVTEALVISVNQTLDTVLATAGSLQGEINKQNQSIETTVKEYSSEINDFLSNAGYKYSVAFELDNEKYKLRLKHHEYDKSLQSGDQFLSFGERNAFALVLFMYQSISTNVGLVVLDDPISSFDRNKKFALVDMLFTRRRSLKGKTVLMLTHDFEPIIDMIYNLKRKFGNSTSATFIGEVNGTLNERPITKTDIKSFTEVCFENIARLTEPIVKLVHLRRYFEIVNDKSAPYELLSNLFHKRTNPTRVADGVQIPLTQDEILEGTAKIREHIATFDYDSQLRSVLDTSYLKRIYLSAANNYEKLQIFRIATGGEAVGDNVLRKYINETFHIENDYVMQLNPCIFQTTPNYIVDKCDEEMSVLT